MPILRSLPLWPNPQESIGRQILSSRVGRRKVWYPQGPALEAFEKVIEPEIENNLKQLDLGCAEIFIRLYMVGRNSENANPMIMICSTNKTARDAAEATIRESGLLEKHQGFGLGAATLPLEHPTPVRRLSPDGQGDSVSAGSGTSHDTIASSQQISPFLENLPFYPRQYPPSDSSTPDASSPLIVNALISSAGSSIPDTSTVVYATSTHPRLGRRIFSPTKDGQISQHYATAGIIIKVGEDYFQLTAGHLFEGESEISDENQSLMSLDECHFDGQSSDEHDSDYESEITGRGSATPEDAQSGNESTSDSTNGKTNDGCTIDMRRNSNQETNMLHQWPTNIFPPHQTQEPIGSSSVVRTNSANLNIKFPIGHLPPGRPIRPTIDYAMISLSSDSVNIMGKDIDPYEFSHPPVKAVAEVGREECSIIVVTSSAIIRGTLIPGKVAYRGPPLHQFDKLVQIILELELFEGDCGSPVLDKSSGSLYGHIVMGIAGTRIAYIVQAVDIFQDIVTKTGKPVSIVIGKDVTEMTVPLADSYVPASQHPSRSEGWYGLSSSESSHTSARNPVQSLLSTTPTPSVVNRGDTNIIAPLSARSHILASQNSSYPTVSWVPSASFQCRAASPVFSHSSMSSASTGISAPDTDLFSYARDQLPCEFMGYGGCNMVFNIDDVDGWIEHIVQDHLQNLLPKKVVCWFCDDCDFDSGETGDRRLNFDQRMYHIHDHFLNEIRYITDMRPDHHLNTHLHNFGLISNEVYHIMRRWVEVPEPLWIIAHDEVPPSRSDRDLQVESINPHDEERQRRRHRQRRSRRSRR